MPISIGKSGYVMCKHPGCYSKFYGPFGLLKCLWHEFRCLFDPKIHSCQTCRHWTQIFDQGLIDMVCVCRDCGHDQKSMLSGISKCPYHKGAV